MNKQRLDEIKQRTEAATAGDWIHLEVEPDMPFWGEIRAIGTAEKETFILVAEMPRLDDRTEDFRFIAHAKEDVADLLAEVERLQAELKLSKSIQDDTPLTYNIMAPEIIDIALKYPHIYKHSYQLEIKCQELETKFNQLMEFCLAAGLTPEWVEKTKGGFGND